MRTNHGFGVFTVRCTQAGLVHMKEGKQHLSFTSVSAGFVLLLVSRLVHELTDLSDVLTLVMTGTETIFRGPSLMCIQSRRLIHRCLRHSDGGYEDIQRQIAGDSGSAEPL